MKQRTFAANQRFRVKRSKKVRQRFYAKNHRRCWYCGEGVKKKAFRLEHQEPFSIGGSCRLNENIVLACVRCDTEKGRRSVDSYRSYLEQLLQRPVAFYGESGRNLKRENDKGETAG